MKNKSEKEIIKKRERGTSKYLVSICCTTYNHQKYIAKTLDGFLMQKTNFPFEVLIHDDASTDETQEIIKKYQNKYTNIIFPIFQKENQYSKGIKTINPMFNFNRARGEYIAICEGDDYWTDENKLQKQVNCFKENPEISECFHPVFIVNEKGDEIDNYYGPPIIKKFYTTEELLLYGNFIPTSSIMIKKENMQDLPFWFLKMPVGDWPLNVLSSMKGKVRMINEKMSVWRKHDKGVFSLKDDYYKLLIELRSLYIYRAGFNKKYKKIINNRVSRIILQLYLDYDVNINLNKLRKLAISSFFSGFIYERLRIIHVKLLFAILIPKLYKKIKRMLKNK